MRRLRDPVLRLGFRVGYHVLHAWWLLTHPKKRGVKCVLTRDGQVMLVGQAKLPPSARAAAILRY